MAAHDHRHWRVLSHRRCASPSRLGLITVGPATGVIAPIGVEALISYIKGENYSFERGLNVLDVIAQWPPQVILPSA